MFSGMEDEIFKRWYDQDPVLSRALEQLRNASDRYQAQVALNILKIIIEHQIETQTDASVENLGTSLSVKGKVVDPQLKRRWYDVNETLSSAIQLLHDCPEDLQKSIIPSIAHMIEQTLQAPI